MKQVLEKFMDWLWLNHNVLTDADKNKEAIEQYLLSEDGKKALSLFNVSGSLDLDLLGKRLDEALAKETPESLDKWLKGKRQ